MTLAELVTRLLAEGFDYLTTTQAEEYLNDAYLLDVCEGEDWPFLEASAEGTAPLEIADLRDIEYVVDATQEIQLRPIDRRHLVADVNTDLTAEGSPTWYYLTQGKTINVFEANTTDTLQVRYWKVPTRLGSGGSPILPERFHTLIVDAAAARAYENSDDYELAQNRWVNFERRLAGMRESLGVQHRDGPDQYIELTNPDLAI